MEEGGVKYDKVEVEEYMACYKCSIYSLNICSPMPKCINGNYIYKHQNTSKK